MIEDPYEAWPVQNGQPKHKRLDGTWSREYFCMSCGGPCTAPTSDHGPGKCMPNQPLVDALRALNGW